MNSGPTILNRADGFYFWVLKFLGNGAGINSSTTILNRADDSYFWVLKYFLGMALESIPVLQYSIELMTLPFRF